MPHQNRVHTFGTSSSVDRVRCSFGSGQISSSIFSWHSCQFPRNSAFAIGASGLAVTAAAATAAAAIVAVTMSLTKAQQNAYKKMKEQKNKAPAGQTAEGKAKSKADAEAHVCQVG